MGRVFGFAAVVRGGRAAADRGVALEVAGQLVNLAEKKVFMREAATAVLLELAGEGKCFYLGLELRFGVEC